MRPTPVAAGRTSVATAALTEVHGRTVSWFRLAGGPHRGALGAAEGDVMARAVRRAIEAGLPIVGELATSGADVGQDVAGLHAWGRVAAALTAASGNVPIILLVTGPCLSGPALLLGLADHVVMTDASFAYVSGPNAVERMTGLTVDHRKLGGAAMHATQSGLASLVAPDVDAAYDDAAELLSYLPDNCMTPPAGEPVTDPVTRPCERAAAAVPERATASYDVRVVVRDVMDEGSFLELREQHAASVVIGYARLAGHSVGIVANQPCQLAGTLDIDASRKAARFVATCDRFNLPIVTFVDTPGFQPGKELEWRGIIRHGAELVHAYAEATVPRACVILRKAYGGAYIVMDSRGLGTDLALAWPTAEIAVMGAAGAVEILARRRLSAVEDPVERQELRTKLIADYEAEHLSPRVAMERGFVDDVIDPVDTRAVLAGGLARLANKREHLPRRKHSNTPL
jgi:acetyl-CoA carboxylase carboxyltransferase component